MGISKDFLRSISVNILHSRQGTILWYEFLFIKLTLSYQTYSAPFVLHLSHLQFGKGAMGPVNHNAGLPVHHGVSGPIKTRKGLTFIFVPIRPIYSSYNLDLSNINPI